MFGEVPYGSTFIIEVLATSFEESLGCEPFNESFGTNFALLMERGDCTFATKAFNAQTSGATMAIIIDTNEESVDSIIPIDDGNRKKLRNTRKKPPLLESNPNRPKCENSAGGHQEKRWESAAGCHSE